MRLSIFLKRPARIAGRVQRRFWTVLLLVALPTAGCAHYTVNKPVPQLAPQGGYRAQNVVPPENSESIMLLLTFSGGGTRAAALSYGVLEELKRTEINTEGRRRRLLDEVDWIAGVSGGSFTAAYYGLFGDRIFEDFENQFLKKNIQRALLSRVLFNPVNWFKLGSGFYGRSDLAADYYDEHVFDGGTIGDIAARKGPMISINATDMVQGIRVAFNQDYFDLICSDLMDFPVARACAASSAVPVLLSPITLRNYAGRCGYELPESLQEALRERTTYSRQFYLANNLEPLLDAEEKPYIHLVDGGVADNLGLRAALERVLLMGDVWQTVNYAGQENVHKIVFFVVNAETQVDAKWDKFSAVPPAATMLQSYSSIAISRYNQETLALLRESFARWAQEIRDNRCPSGEVDLKPGSCGDIEFYLVEVRFDALPDENEREYFKGLPTSFKLKAEDVDRLRDAARRILQASDDYNRFLADLH